MKSGSVILQLVILKIGLVILYLLIFLLNFRENLSISIEKANWNFDWYCFDSIDQFVENWHFKISINMVSLSIYLGHFHFSKVLYLSVCISYMYVFKCIPKSIITLKLLYMAVFFFKILISSDFMLEYINAINCILFLYAKNLVSSPLSIYLLRTSYRDSHIICAKIRV